MRKKNLIQLALLTILMQSYHSLVAQTLAEQIQVYGDFRVRFESDSSSTRSSGLERDDRKRLRARARFGVKFNPTDAIEVGIRLRSGSDDSHQSPHITIVDFDDNDTGDSDFNPDKWYFKYHKERSSLSVGRDAIAFWKQNEFVLDDDVTPLGLGFSIQGDVLGFKAGYYTMPAGMQESAGNLGSLQLTFARTFGTGSLQGAFGLLDFAAEPNDGDALVLLDSNGLRDYQIWVVSAQVKFDKLKFSLDFMHNSENYSSTDANAFTAFHSDEDSGYVFSAAHGGTGPQNWLFAYYFAHIETFAVNSSFAQDDWVRFGSAVESRGSNIEGHEIRVGYGLAKNMNVILRTYFVDAIRDRSATAVSKEDGTRIRLDFNFKF